MQQPNFAMLTRTLLEITAYDEQRSTVVPLSLRCRSAHLLSQADKALIESAPSRGREAWDDTYSGILAGEAIRKSPEIVRSVVSIRSTAVATSSGAEARPFAKGRILLYTPENALHMRLAERESSGIVDASECPGWNYWLQAHYGAATRAAAQPPPVLLSWIPADVVRQVEEAVNADPTDTLTWVTRETVPVEKAAEQLVAWCAANS